MSMFSSIRGLWDAAKRLGLGTQIGALLYPYRKAYYDGRFAGASASGAVDPGAGRSDAEPAAGDAPERQGRPVKGSPLRGVSAVLGLHKNRARPPSSTYSYPGRLLAHRRYAPDANSPAQQFLLTCENTVLQIAVLAPDLMRVRVSPTGRFATLPSYAVARADHEWPAVPCSVQETDEALILRTPRLHCHVDKAHSHLSFLDPDGAVIHADASGVGWQEDKIYRWTHQPLNEHIYGLGQKTLSLDKRGMATEMWNTDPAGYDPGEDPIYSNIPFYLGLNEGRGYGVFYEHAGWSRFDLGAGEPAIARFEAEATGGGELCYYFFYGPQLSTVLERYTELTGRMAMPPLWALGYHQNRWSYTPEARVRQVAAEFRQRQIPCEAIHLDIDYMDGYRCFTWHPERFPDPGRLIADLHGQGFKVVAMIDPGIKVDRDYRVCAEGLERDMFCTYPDGALFSGPVWPGNCYFPDFTSPRVRAWWGELYRGMVDLGVDGFWNDMNEPAVFGHGTATFPDSVVHDWEGHGACHRELHNVYGMQMARATVEGLRKLRLGVEPTHTERPLVISRSVWAGSQRYNMHWLGDNRSDWPSLRNTIPLALNMGLSGIAFTGPDTGGFTGTPDGELLARWNQLSAFTPFFRNHTATGTGDQEPWALGEECERISRQYIELRYRLLPYCYTAFWQSAQSGMPMMRPLFLIHQDEPYAAGIEDEFMFGDALLVAPILEQGRTSRPAYLPRGRWYDFWEDALTAGPQIARLEAPLDRLPLLVRAGSVVPAWPLMQYVGERPVDVLTLHVYPGDGESALYEDDGRTWAFQGGEYRLTRFRCEARWAPGARQPIAVRVRRSAEGRFTPAYERVRVALHGLDAAPREVWVDGAPVADSGFDAGAHLCPPADGTALPRPPFVFEAGMFETIEVQM
jgi:alpha-glucosidase